MSSFIAFWFNFRWRGIDAGEEYPAANPLPDAAGAIRVLTCKVCGEVLSTRFQDRLQLRPALRT